MDHTLWLSLAAFVALLGLSAFFSSAETSLFSLSRLQIEQMKKEKNPKAVMIERLLSQPRRLIVTILIGNELVNITASVISAAVVIKLLGADSKWLNVFVMVPLLLLFGEITPKTLAIRNNVAFASFQCRPIDLFAALITPVRRIVRWMADYFITLMVGEQRGRANIVTEDMVRSLAREAVGEGSLDTQEAHYIHQIFDFGDLTVHDVMTPRSRLFSVTNDMNLDDIAAEFCSTRHSRAPVFDAESGTAVGVLFARDLLSVDLQNRAPEDDRAILSRLLREPYVVPETKPAADLFLTFRRRKLSLALTADEYGGVTGIVTMEDLLECIFGDIPSRSELLKQQQIGFEDLGGDRYRIGGSMPIEQFNRLLNARLSDEIAETVGGELLHRFGELPEEGAPIVVDEFEFTIETIDQNRISSLIVKALAPESAVPPETPSGATAVEADKTESQPKEPVPDSDDKDANR